MRTDLTGLFAVAPIAAAVGEVEGAIDKPGGGDFRRVPDRDLLPRTVFLSEVFDESRGGVRREDDTCAPVPSSDVTADGDTPAFRQGPPTGGGMDGEVEVW